MPKAASKRMAPRGETVHTRRRGEQLEHAVYEATVEELIATGYADLTMEGIATRARCGKSVLYRRWPGKRELVLAALSHQLPPLPAARRDQSARQNLMTVFSSLVDVFAGQTPYPGLAVIAQLLHDPDLRAAYGDSVVAPRMRVIEAIIAAGVASGEIDPAAITELTARTGPALIVQRVLLSGTIPTQDELAQIVDTLLAR